MLDRIKTILLVTIVTLLIWVFAESEGLRAARLSVDVVVQAEPESNRAVRIADGGSLSVLTVRVEGATANVDALRDALRRPVMLRPGMPGFTSEPGRHRIDLLDVLRAHPTFRERGISVQDVEPPVVEVEIDEVVERPVPVEVRVPEGTQLEGPPEAEPASVIVRLPRQAWERLPGEARVVARLDAATLRPLPVARRTTVNNVRVELPPGLSDPTVARIQPPQVSVTLTLRSGTESTVIPSVPVHLRIAPAEYGRWDVQVPEEDRFIKDVRVSGPRAWVGDIESGQVPLVATVSLSYEELERASRSAEPLVKEAIFALLPGDLHFEADDTTVRVYVRARAPANGAVSAPAGAANGP